MATKTIDGLNENTSPLLTDNFPTAKGGSDPDLKTSLQQIVQQAQSNFSPSSNIIYVSNKQTGTGNGSVTSQFATIAEAFDVFENGDLILVDTGSYDLPNEFPDLLRIRGTGKNSTVFLLDAPANTNNHFAFEDVSFFSISGEADFTYSSYDTNGYQIYKNVVFPLNFSTGKVRSLIFDNVDIAGLDILDCNNININGAIFTGNLLFTCTDGLSLDTVSLLAKNTNFNNKNINIQPQTGGSNISIKFISSPGINTLSYDGLFSGTTATLYCDAISSPTVIDYDNDEITLSPIDIVASTFSINRAQEPAKAGFHYGFYSGKNDGKFLFSAMGTVADADLSASEINPYCTSDSIAFKGKDSFGRIVNFDLKSLPGYAFTGSSNTYTALNTFNSAILLKEVQNPLVENITPVSITANSGTLTAAQLVSGVLFFTPTASATYTFPLGTSIDSILSTPSANRGRKSVRFVNNSEFPIVFTANTGMTFGGVTSSGIFLLKPYSDITEDLVKLDSTPTYSIFGQSFSIGYSVYNVTGTTKTFSLVDYNSFQNCSNASAQTMTFPPNSSVAFPIGTRIDGAQIGAGQVTLAAGAGVTLQSKLGNLKTAAQYSGWSATKTATDTWLIVGDLAA
jgi:hypothetical protein